MTIDDPGVAVNDHRSTRTETHSRNGAVTTSTTVNDVRQVRLPGDWPGMPAVLRSQEAADVVFKPNDVMLRWERSGEPAADWAFSAQVVGQQVTDAGVLVNDDAALSKTLSFEQVGARLRETEVINNYGGALFASPPEWLNAAIGKYRPDGAQHPFSIKDSPDALTE